MAEYKTAETALVSFTVWRRVNPAEFKLVTRRTDDGVVIYMQNRGCRWGPPEVMAALSRREPVDSSAYYMRTVPKFDVPEGRYAWLGRFVFVGVAEKTPTGNSIAYFKVL